MLRDLDDNGNVTWHCHNPDCAHHAANGDRPHQAHVSHEGIQVHLPEGSPVHHRTVSLPACACGVLNRVFLKVDYTPAELANPNMHDENGQPTETWHAAQRHMRLVKHLEQAGKA